METKQRGPYKNIVDYVNLYGCQYVQKCTQKVFFYNYLVFCVLSCFTLKIVFEQFKQTTFNPNENSWKNIHIYLSSTK